MNLFIHFIKRVLIVAIPLVCLYFFSMYSIAENNKKLHKGDVGLGLAILLFFILAILLIGFIIDLIYRLRRKQYKIAWTNVPFLLLFLIPISYIHCQMGGCCDTFCEWFITLF